MFLLKKLAMDCISGEYGLKVRVFFKRSFDGAKIRGIFEMCKMFNKNIFIAICFRVKRTDIQLYTHSKILFPFSISFI